MANHGQVVFQRELAERMIFGGEELFFPRIPDAPGLPLPRPSGQRSAALV